MGIETEDTSAKKPQRRIYEINSPFRFGRHTGAIKHDAGGYSYQSGRQDEFKRTVKKILPDGTSTLVEITEKDIHISIL